MNPEILNPEILNPEILNPEILNPEILNPEILNPEILNPEILNPEILNPEILNPEILNTPRLTDITWTVRNDGNTTSSYTAKPFIAQELPVAANFKFQLLIYRIHATPAVNAITCELETEPLRQRQHHELIVDIRNPEILNPEILNPEILNHDPNVATFYAAPGETVRVTLRMLDPDITDEYDLNTDAVALATISHAVDSDDAANNEMQPDVEVQTSTGVPIDILTTSLPEAIVGSAYSATLVAAGGVPPLVWSEQSSVLGVVGTPCEGLEIDHGGAITGTPINIGTCGPFIIRVTDDDLHTDTRELSVIISESPEEWVKTYNGPLDENDGGNAVALDSSGNIYVTGFSVGNDTDIITVKYDPSGNQIWLQRYDGPSHGSDWGSVIALDGSDNVYVAGRSYDSVTSDDFITIKYDSDGNEKWVTRYNGPADDVDHVRAIALDGAGNIYVTGLSVGNGTGWDYATVKYDGSGTQLWAARLNGSASGRDAAEAMVVDTNGDVYVTGYSTGGATAEDYLTVKYQSDNGAQLWARTYSSLGNPQNDRAGAVTVDSAGDVYVTGFIGASSAGQDFATVKYDSNGVEQWVRTYDGPPSNNDRAYAVTPDGSGNVYVTGRSVGDGTGSDFATLKYSSGGDELWVSRYNGPGNQLDDARAISLDSEGNVYVTGHSYGTSNDLATVKYDNDGKEKWVKRYNGSGDGTDGGFSLVVDSTGSVYVTGFTDREPGPGINNDVVTLKYRTNDETWVRRYPTMSLWPRAMTVDEVGNVYVLARSSDVQTIYDFLTIKYDSTGDMLWQRNYDFPGHYTLDDERPHDLVVDQDGNVIVTGLCEGTAVRGDYVTVKYDNDGNEIWVRRYNGPGNDYDEANAIAVDNLGNIYVTGRSYDNAGTGMDYATVKYDSSGTEVWVRRYHGPAVLSHPDWPNDIAIDSLGNVYVTGQSYGITSRYDYATIKYNSSGDEMWVARYDGLGSNQDIAQRLVLDSSGNVYVTGYSSSGVTTGFDYMTIKYDNSGNELWTRSYNGGANAVDRAWGLALDASGNLLVTGDSVGVGTESDYATIKYDAAGNEIWIRRYNGNSNGVDWARDVAVDHEDCVYVTGYSDSTREDYLTLKYDSDGNQLWLQRYDYGSRDHAYLIAIDPTGAVVVTGESRDPDGGVLNALTIKYRN